MGDAASGAYLVCSGGHWCRGARCDGLGLQKRLRLSRASVGDASSQRNARTAAADALRGQEPPQARARDTPLLGCTPMNKTSRLRWWLTAERSRCPQALTTTDSPLRMLAQGAGSWSRTTSSGTTLPRQSVGSGRGAGTTLPARQQAGWPNLATPASNRWAQGWGPGWPTTAYPSHLCRAPLTSRRLPRLEGSESPPTGPLTCSCRIQTQ